MTMFRFNTLAKEVKNGNDSFEFYYNKIDIRYCMDFNLVVKLNED